VAAVGGYVTKKRGQVCVVPKLSRVTRFVQTLLPREKKLPIGLRVGSGMLNSMTISPLSPPAHHGAACSENGMSFAFHWTAGQVRTCICPSPQSSLPTEPRFVET
jgi:hypothetical protein